MDKIITIKINLTSLYDLFMGAVIGLGIVLWIANIIFILN